ncbi:MAG: ATP-binding protein, partial [bacterium]
ALRQLATQMQERHDLHIDLDIQDELDRFPESIKIQLFSFIQELLFNVAKHAGSRQANVGIKKDARRAEVTVSDTGKGFEWRPELATENKAGGYGLFRISEQLENLGGVLSITSVPGKGSCIKMVVPEAGHPVDSTE